MIGDRSGAEPRQHIKRWAAVEDLDFANVFQREPNLGAIGGHSDVRAERAVLGHAPHDLMIGQRNNHRLWRERRADISKTTVRGKNLHARSRWDRNTRDLSK